VGPLKRVGRKGAARRPQVLARRRCRHGRFSRKPHHSHLFTTEPSF
jgi:hypothetical protein